MVAHHVLEVGLRLVVVEVRGGELAPSIARIAAVAELAAASLSGLSQSGCTVEMS